GWGRRSVRGGARAHGRGRAAGAATRGRRRCRGRGGWRTSAPCRPEIIGQADEAVERAWRARLCVGLETAALRLIDGVEELARAFEDQPFGFHLEVLHPEA